MSKFIRPASIITTQEQAQVLPSRIGSPYEKITVQYSCKWKIPKFI